MKKKKYKGFLRITCDHCGHTKEFSMKNPTDRYICHECEKETPLHAEAMRPLYVNCECGSSFKYMTNSVEGEFDINCLNCGAPVAVGWNKKEKCYKSYNDNY